MSVEFEKIIVIGAGAMGRGIAQVATQAGSVVRLYDIQPEQAEAAWAFVEKMLRRAAEKGRMATEDAEQAIARVTVAETLEACADADLVVEAIVENLEIKQQLFRTLESVVSPECVLATNTSSLSVTRIAATCERPERVVGYHFFNPVPLMRVVEVVRAQRTSAAVIERLSAYAKQFGHTPVIAEDSPGFLVNHAGRGLFTEGLRILQESIAEPVDVDRVMREVAGFRMGPFELLDLTGLDVSVPVMEQIYGQFFQEPRFRPTPLAARRFAAGVLGRKVGEGFYRYRDGQQEVLPETPAPEFTGGSVWVSPENPEGVLLVREFLGKIGVAPESGECPSDEALCLVTPLGADTTTTALAQSLAPERTVAVDVLFGFKGRCTLMGAPTLRSEYRNQAHALFAQNGGAVTVVRDSPGFVAQRIVAMIVNIASDIAQQRIATPEDINQAVRLGLGYPQGPLDLGDFVGPQRILAILEAMHTFYGDPRYRPSPWLKRRALLGISLNTLEW